MKCPNCHVDNPKDPYYGGKCWIKLDSTAQISFTKTLETTKDELTQGVDFAGRKEVIVHMQKRLFTVLLSFILTLCFLIISSVNAQEAKLPQQKITLTHPKPNPFNSSIVISYELSEPQYVETSIGERMGDRVGKDFSGIQAAGHHEITFDPKGLPWGVYIFSIRSRPSREALRQGPSFGLNLYYTAGEKHLTASNEEGRVFNQAFANVHDDPPRGVRMLQDFFRDYPKSIYRPSALNLMLDGYTKILMNPNEYPLSETGFSVTGQDLLEASHKLISLSPTSPNYHRVAQKLLEWKVSLPAALKHARRALILNEKGEFFSLPYQRQDILQTIGRINLALGKPKKALKPLIESLNLCDRLLGNAEFVSSGALYERAKYLRPSILLDLGCAYQKAGRLDEAEQALSEVFLSRPADKEVFQDIRTLYVKKYGSSEGFEVYFDGLNKKSLSNILPKSLERLNRKALDFELMNFAGSKVKLSDFRGRLVILNFWGYWCGACKEEIPYLQELWDRYRARGVIVLAVHFDPGVYSAERNREILEKFIAKSNLTFPILMHEGDLAARYGGTSVPATYLIDQNGLVQYEFLGFDKNSDMPKQIDEKVQELLRSQK